MTRRWVRPPNTRRSNRALQPTSSAGPPVRVQEVTWRRSRLSAQVVRPTGSRGFATSFFCGRQRGVSRELVSRYAMSWQSGTGARCCRRVRRRAGAGGFMHCA